MAFAAGPDPQGTIYVADAAANKVDVFAPGANGNVAPIRAISGSLTGLSEPADIKVDAVGDVWVSNFGTSTVTEYAPGASGNVAPIKTIGGSNTLLNTNDDMSLTPDGSLFVGNFVGTSVVVFAPGASGNVAPIRTISGSNTGLGLTDGVGADAAGTLYAAETQGAAIRVFAPGANGNVAPERTISGPLTGLAGVNDIVVGFSGNLFVTTGSGFGGANSVLVFPPGANGNVAPTQNIQGSNTGFINTDDLGVDATGRIFVCDAGGGAIDIFSPGVTGNVAPNASIRGPLTTLAEPEGVFVAGPPSTASATVTTSASASAISLGSPTFDTATVAGGTSPSGLILFKLFGPGDATCSAAPAFTSPTQSVNGDGTYTSPSFTPTVAGTYGWQALYSGDSQNSAVTTACGDRAEAVTVATGPIDKTPPSCALTAVIAGPPKQIQITTQDTGSGLKSIVVTENTNVTVSVPALAVGTTSPVIVTATKIDQSSGASVALQVTDVAGNVTNCDPIMTDVSNGPGERVQTFHHVSKGESHIWIYNNTPGLTSMRVIVDGRSVNVSNLKDGETRMVDVSSLMRRGNNTVRLVSNGKSGGSATVLIADV